MTVIDPRYEVLRIAMRQIAWPIRTLQEYAKEQGRQLDGGVAVQLAKDPGYLSGIAAQAMADIAMIDPTGVNDPPYVRSPGGKASEVER